MIINTSWLKAALVGVVLSQEVSGCPGVCPDAVHQFSATMRFTPENDSVHVGETLYLSSLLPTTLIDGRSGQSVDFGHASDIGSDIFFDELPEDSSVRKNLQGSVKYSIDGFSVVARKGRIYSVATAAPQRVKQLTYQQVGTNYELLIGIVPLRKGVFCLTVGNGFSNGRSDQGCDKAAFDIRLSNTNQHLYYLANYFNNTTVAPFSARGGYCFKVY